MTYLDEMLLQAKQAMLNAYIPYSQYAVGACIKTSTGKYFAASNIENAAYGLTLCAETVALGNMLTAGERTITEVVVMAEGIKVCSPCGACRQRIREFAAPSILIHLCNTAGQRKPMSLAELLPEAFGPENLQRP